MYFNYNDFDEQSDFFCVVRSVQQKTAIFYEETSTSFPYKNSVIKYINLLSIILKG